MKCLDEFFESLQELNEKRWEIQEIRLGDINSSQDKDIKIRSNDRIRGRIGSEFERSNIKRLQIDMPFRSSQLIRKVQ